MAITPETFGNDPKVLEAFVVYLETVAVSKKTSKRLGEGSVKTYKSNAGSFLKSYGNVELKYLLEDDYIHAALDYDHKQSSFKAYLKKSHHGILHLKDMYRYYNKKEPHETEKDYYDRIFKHKAFNVDHIVMYEVDYSKMVSTQQWVREYVSSRYDKKTLTKEEMIDYVTNAVAYVEQQKTRNMYAQWNMVFETSKKRKTVEDS